MPPHHSPLFEHSPARVLRGVIALAATITVTAGCTPDPTPTPTPTPLFATEDDAFTAAEQVYRDYVDALNAIDPEDPKSFEPVFAFASGSVLKADRENLSTMHAEGHHIDGDSHVLSFQGDTAKSPFAVVTASACLDVRDVNITDGHGNSLVSKSRPDIYAISLTFREHHGRLHLDQASRIDDETCSL